MAGKRSSSDSESWKAAAPAAATTAMQPKAAQSPAQDKPLLSHSASFRASFSPATGDQQLFQTPSDLVCPITLTLFQDPVINSLGQVYERSAIQRHLIQAAVNGQPPTDPVSNATLPSLDLVPVFPMRSRAAEYRESTARTCMQAAAAPDCQQPVRYLRRAAELVLSTADASSSSPRSSATGGQGSGAPAGPIGRSRSSGSLGLNIPGMTADFARYLAAHRGIEHDALALKYFGNELLRAGAADAAADVFYRLLLEAEERVQQAEYLQLCMDCWTSSSSSSSSTGGSAIEGAAAAALAGSSPGGEQAAQQPPAAAAAAAVAETVNPAIVDKLADFVQRQHSLSPSAIIHMLQGMTHGPAMSLRLCQVLLARAAAAAMSAAAATAAAGPSSEGEASLGLPGGLGGALELLLALVDLSSGQLQEQQRQLAAQLQALAAAQQQLQGTGRVAAADDEVAAAAAAAGTDGCVSPAVPGAAAAAAVGGGRKGARQGAGGRAGRAGRCVWSGGKGRDVVLGRAVRAVAAGTLAVASLFGGNQLPWRLARVGPLVYLLRAGL